MFAASVMTANVLIKGAWIAAMVYLIINQYPIWGGACFVGALISSFSIESTNG